jgi:hypothetical protein
MSFSWEKDKDGIAVAITSSKTKSLNDRILYLHKKVYGEDKKRLGNIKKIKLHDIERLVEIEPVKNKTKVVSKLYKAISNGDDEFYDADPKVMELYERLGAMPDKNGIELPDGVTFELLPRMPEDLVDGNYRQSIFIVGQGGSGKSYWLRQYVMLYHEMYPKNKVFYISQEDIINDESLKDITKFVKQISKEQLLGVDDIEPLEWTDIPDKSLVLFDDYEGYGKKDPLKTVVHKLLDNLLLNGRKHYITVLASAHELNKQQNSIVLKEMQYYVLFPDGVSLYHLTYFCKNYLGFSKERIQSIKNNRSRWVVIHKQVPMYLLSQHICEVLE